MRLSIAKRPKSKSDEQEVRGYAADMSNCLAADYGGAFDIEPDMFFTREEIDEFADDVATELDSELDGVKVYVSDVYMTDANHLHIDFDLDDGDGASTASSDIRIDFRRITKPSDINKYKEAAKEPVRQMYNEYFKSITSATDPTLSDDRFNPPEYPDPVFEEGEEDIYVPFDGQIRVMNDGYWDWVDASYPWSKPSNGSNWWKGEYYPVDLCDAGAVEEYVRDGISPFVPDHAPGTYLVSGEATITFDVSRQLDEYDEPIIDNDSAQLKDIDIANFKCIPVRG